MQGRTSFPSRVYCLRGSRRTSARRCMVKGASASKPSRSCSSLCSAAQHHHSQLHDSSAAHLYNFEKMHFFTSEQILVAPTR